MENAPRQQVSQARLVALTSARADLAEILADTIRRRMSARTALWVAKAADFDPDVAVGDGGTPVSPAQLMELIRKLEFEEAQTRNLLARIDERIEEISMVVEWSMH